VRDRLTLPDNDDLFPRRQLLDDLRQMALGFLNTDGLHRVTSSDMLLPDDLDQHALRPAAVELAVEDLLPRAEVQLALRDRHDDLTAHDLPLQVGVGVVLAGAVVVVHAGVRVERGQPLQPLLVVPVQRPPPSSLINPLALICTPFTKHAALPPPL